MLTPEQKACRQQFCEENLDRLRGNTEHFFSRIITGDETWVHQDDPGNKQEFMQWKQEILCETISRKEHSNSFLGLRRCSAYRVQATQDNHY